MDLKNGINVLSLFDGMSCGALAFAEAGLRVNKYYASEIDKPAMKVSKANWPNHIFLGDVRNINANDLKNIDIIIGGSPCQSFSFAGKMKGMVTKDDVEILTLHHYLQLKSDGFEFEGQSYLFWEFIRLVVEIKPTYFFLENVVMVDKWKKLISKTLGTNPLEFNSKLVSAQSRERLYWTNINQKTFGLFGDTFTDIPAPKDNGILLKHIMESDVDEKYFLTEDKIRKILNWNAQEKPLQGITTNFTKVGCLTARGNHDLHSGMKLLMEVENEIAELIMQNPAYLSLSKQGNLKTNQEKASTICGGGNSGGNHSDMDLLIVPDDSIGCLKIDRTDEAKGERRENNKKGKDYNSFNSKTITGIDFEKMNTLVTGQSKESGGKQPYQQNRIYSVDGIAPALMR